MWATGGRRFHDGDSMTDVPPTCVYCGEPTTDLCGTCGQPFGRDHGAIACPGCAHRSPLRARWIPALLPSGRCFGLILVLLATGSALVILVQLLWPAGS